MVRSAGSRLHRMTGSRLHCRTGSRLHCMTGGGLHCRTGSRLHRRTGGGLHRRTGSGLHCRTGCRLHCRTGSGLHCRTGCRLHCRTDCRSSGAGVTVSLTGTRRRGCRQQSCSQHHGTAKCKSFLHFQIPLFFRSIELDMGKCSTQKSFFQVTVQKKFKSFPLFFPQISFTPSVPEESLYCRFAVDFPVYHHYIIPATFKTKGKQ